MSGPDESETEKVRSMLGDRAADLVDGSDDDSEAGDDEDPMDRFRD